MGASYAAALNFHACLHTLGVEMPDDKAEKILTVRDATEYFKDKQ